jgi:hypothetical protein
VGAPTICKSGPLAVRKVLSVEICPEREPSAGRAVAQAGVSGAAPMSTRAASVGSQMRPRRSPYSPGGSQPSQLLVYHVEFPEGTRLLQNWRDRLRRKRLQAGHYVRPKDCCSTEDAWLDAGDSRDVLVRAARAGREVREVGLAVLCIVGMPIQYVRGDRVSTGDVAVTTRWWTRRQRNHTWRNWHRLSRRAVGAGRRF